MLDDIQALYRAESTAEKKLDTILVSKIYFIAICNLGFLLHLFGIIYKILTSFYMLWKWGGFILFFFRS